MKDRKSVNVLGFTDKLGDCENIPVVHAVLAWDDPYTGETSILMVYNALYFEEMEVNLIPPIMIRLAGAEINKCSNFCVRVPLIKTTSSGSLTSLDCYIFISWA